ncbi:hypothetical protein Tsubulata_026642 [Turnera subulata]|uniref:Uncharacterized protein n=1 Tax=Turnera subulata TaxID=218843 RepID=A0A9Q0IZE3_9ROSI|nr:hypothetical protein Tsubulata_026642 [Turnera subulata]
MCDSFKARCAAEGTSSEGSNGEEVCAAPDKEKEVALWVEVAGGVKKGRVYGLAGQARWVGSTSSGNDEEMNDDSEEGSSAYETGEDDGMDSEGRHIA